MRGCMREATDVDGPGIGESSRGEADDARVAVAVGGPKDLVMVSSPLEALSLLMLLSTLPVELDAAAAAAAQLEAATDAALELQLRLGPLPR